MVALIAGSAAGLVGLLSLLLLVRVFGRRNVSGRIADYLAISGRETAATTVRRERGFRGAWLSLGRLAPKRLSQHYSDILQKASIPLKGEELASAIGVSTLLGMVLGGLVLSVPGWFLGAYVGAKLPGWLLKSHLRRRLRIAEEQLVDFLAMTANAMRAGHSFLQALDLAAREMPDPIGLELRRTLREVNLGLTVEDALLRLVDRLPSPDLDLLITAVLIQRQVGGDLASILDNIAATIRGRQRIKGEVQTLTAQGRMSGWVISLMPIGLALILNTMNPEYMRLLWTDPIGIILLAVGAVSMSLGIFIINKIVKIDI